MIKICRVSKQILNFWNQHISVDEHIKFVNDETGLWTYVNKDKTTAKYVMKFDQFLSSYRSLKEPGFYSDIIVGSVNSEKTVDNWAKKGLEICLLKNRHQLTWIFREGVILEDIELSQQGLSLVMH